MKTPGPTACYSDVILLSAHLWLFNSKRPCQVLNWTLEVFFKEKSSVFPPWPSIRNGQILWTYVVFILFCFLFLSLFVFLFSFLVIFFFFLNCRCVAILLDSDPSDKSIFLASSGFLPQGSVKGQQWVISVICFPSYRWAGSNPAPVHEVATFVTLTEMLECKYIACLKNVYYLICFYL